MDNRFVRLGDILTRQKVITDTQLEDALRRQKDSGKRLGEWLVSGGMVGEDQIAQALHLQLGFPILDLRSIRIDTDLVKTLPGVLLRKHGVIPVGLDKTDPDALVLAMADPLDTNAVDDISILTNRRVVPVIATASDIVAAIDLHYGSVEALDAAEQYTRRREQTAPGTPALETTAETASAPIIRLVQSIIEQAVRQRASDIHIEALEQHVRIRYRIDGVLSDIMRYDISLLSAIGARIKIISGMDISEKRRPQDGRLTVTVDNNINELRVSSLPSSYGEKIVLRFAPSGALTRSKAELGMRPEEQKLFEAILQNPNGIILVTGPTGSGKSTTLYAAVNSLNDETVNIVTVEDPIEANIAGINQVQVNPKAGMGFADALRSILRQDPDIIMIGEIRDYETAGLAVQASITGHLVVSTLHTNSAAASVTRLMNMGVEAYLLADSLVGLIAQRLVRRLCKHCRTPREAESWEKEFLGASRNEALTIYDPVGCPYCYDTGFHGRIGVYEIIRMSAHLRRIIAKRGTTDEIRTAAIQEGMTTLRDSACSYVRNGITAITDMLKICADC